MSDTTNGSGPPGVCPNCGATRVRAGHPCWLCQEPVPLELEADTQPIKSAPPERFSFSISTMLLIVTLASIALSLIVTMPGLGVFACILMVPVFIRTVRVVHHQEAKGRTVSAGQKAWLFFGSFVVASVLSIVICITAFCTFCGVCLVLVSADRKYGGGGTFLWGLLMCLLAVAAFLGVIRIVKAMRRRYERDKTRSLD